jgi:RHS repeat-associated protein
VISLPKGGGAVSGLGETFSPDLFTGTGNLSVPISLPAGRRGVQPQLALAYSTGNGGGPFGLGWALSLPGVARKTSRGVPRYEPTDTFVLSGAEDLVQVSAAGARVRYRPRTEGSFARIEHVRGAGGDFWEVRSRDGFLSRYGTPRPDGAAEGWRDPAALADAARPDCVFAWKISETRDTFGNLVRYDYLRDQGDDPPHRWDQPLVSRVSYADFGDRAAPSFLIHVDLEYEPRPDACSDYRAGFEIRTTLRCRTIRISTHADDGVERVSKEYRLSYEQAAFNGASLLMRIDVLGVDGGLTERLPPLTFGYSTFEPTRRRFEQITGQGLPTVPLGDPTLALVDVDGSGLPDIVELGVARRCWRNIGAGRFELPRQLEEAPPFALGEAGVRLMDADGDGRPDLVVGGGRLAGYFPMTFAGGWSRRSFQPYSQAPSVGLGGPGVTLVDLDGDGLTDALHSNSELECWFNDVLPQRAWQRTSVAEGLADLDLADSHVRLADMTGDGLQDVVLVWNGNVAYRPNLGHGRWGATVQMHGAPRLPDGYDPRRLLLGDVDGDGMADLVYVDRGRVLLWGNECGSSWSEQPLTVPGTPNVVDADAIQLADLHGSGTGGVLFSRTANRGPLAFLDFTGGVKPHLLDSVDNHLGAQTHVEYRPSTEFYLRDRPDPATRWRTTLPFPVQVVAKVEVVDQISHGRLTTEYRYHHGYWDGVEREFRGFAMVEQLDTETFDRDGLGVHHSPPILTKSWFHPGPVAAAEAGDWVELDLRYEFWDGDPPALPRPAEVAALLAGLSRSDRRAALRALRGTLLRSEVYAVDGGAREQRPYTVTETQTGVREESPPAAGDAFRQRIFFPFAVAQRTTQWERGDEPMSRFTFNAGHDAYGFATRQLSLAAPRRPTEARLATYTTTEYGRRDDADRYLVDRVARTSVYEVVDDGRSSVLELRDAVLGDRADLRLIGRARTYYDGDAFTGLPLGRLGDHGLPVRTESLAFADAFPAELGARPVYLDPTGAAAWPPEYPDRFRRLLPLLAGYVHDGGDVPGSPGGYYIVGARHSYDVHEPAAVPRGLLLASRDALGAESRITYDGHDLLPVETTDPAGLVTTAVPDYRVLQPRRVVDPNGNRTEVALSPAGLVTAQYVRGKGGEGDAAEPSSRLDYDLLAFADHGRPASVRSTRRVHHDTEADGTDETIVSVEYSDGFGRSLQTRAQAEDTLFGDPTFGGNVVAADQSAPVAGTTGRTRAAGEPENVVVSGSKTYDNKGRVVEQYEPFYSTGFDYAEPGDAQRGQKMTIHYDPRGHPVRTIGPDGSEQRVVFGIPADLTNPDVYEPTPWESFAYDANDNAGRTHGQAAAAYADHWNTPSSVEVDALGRTVVVLARNGPDPAAWLATRSEYDIQGNLLSITDPLGRKAFAYRYDLAGRRWRVDGIDVGRRDTVLDALGRSVEARDGKGALTLAAFDASTRPTHLWARDDAASPVTLRQLIEYGDDGDRTAARERNLLGRAARHHDEAGLVTVEQVDFKGNVLESTRRVIADAPILAAYDRAAADGWRVVPFRVDWEQADGDAELLEPTAYRTSTTYDALDRVTRRILPLDVEGRRREVRPTYNRAGRLDQIRLDDAVYVERIAYDAKSRRTLVAYGNGVMTRHAYDPRTSRLTRLRSERYTLAGDASYRPSGQPLQDYGYEYDLAGNVLAIHDRTPGSGLPTSPDALDRRFTYDPIYRLLSATGRECDAPPAGAPWNDAPRCTDVTRARAYSESYVYDPAGNLLELVHTGGRRTLELEAGSNRLARVRVGTTAYRYESDANGNLRSETPSRRSEWDQSDRLKAYATQTDGAEPSVHVQYLYDSTGMRVKRLVRRQSGQVEVTHYVNDLFERRRWPGGENDRVHVMDDRRRVAVVRVGPAEPGQQAPAVQVHLGDHLDSSNVVVDGSGGLVDREEYSPYGESTFGGFAKKRYRFTGNEREEPSGLYYHGARYYAPWTGRWISCDPIGAAGGWNPYRYASGNPLRLSDPTGTQPKEPEKHEEEHAWERADNVRVGTLVAEKVLEHAGPLHEVLENIARPIEFFISPVFLTRELAHAKGPGQAVEGSLLLGAALSAKANLTLRWAGAEMGGAILKAVEASKFVKFTGFFAQAGLVYEEFKLFYRLGTALDRAFGASDWISDRLVTHTLSPIEYPHAYIYDYLKRGQPMPPGLRRHVEMGLARQHQKWPTEAEYPAWLKETLADRARAGEAGTYLEIERTLPLDRLLQPTPAPPQPTARPSDDPWRGRGPWRERGPGGEP